MHLMNKLIRMSKIKPGQSAVVKQVDASENMLRRFLDIGLIGDTKIECIGRSPSGDPSAYLIRGAVIAIRSESCADIMLQLC